MNKYQQKFELELDFDNDTIWALIIINTCEDGDPRDPQSEVRQELVIENWDRYDQNGVSLNVSCDIEAYPPLKELVERKGWEYFYKNNQSIKYIDDIN